MTDFGLCASSIKADFFKGGHEDHEQDFPAKAQRKNL
jgi:hypothetical protein